MQQNLTVEPLEAIWEERLALYRFISENKILPTAEYRERPGRILAASGIEYPTCNAAFELSPAAHILESEIDDVAAFYQEKSLPFIWWTGAKNLDNKGFEFGGVMKGACIDLSEELPIAVPALNINAKLVETEEELEQFCQVCNACFPMGPQADRQMADVTRAIWKHERQLLFLATIQGRAVALATLSLGVSACGVWYCGTIPEYRKNGIGSALALMALQEGQRRGYRLGMAIVKPEGKAWEAFQLIGFKECCDLPFYIYGKPAIPVMEK